MRTEYVKDYKPGGFPPVHVGDTYEQRYRIIHKLGHGGFATVWLARDLHRHRYVAIKMSKSAQKNSEKEVLRSLASRSSSHPGRCHINHLLDHFDLESPYGMHECFVFNLRGPSISALSNETGHRQLQCRTARVLCQQLLMAIDYLYAQKVVHGDVTPSNLLLGLKEEIHQCSEQQILDWIGHPDLSPDYLIMYYDTKEQIPASCPRYLVDSANLWGFGTMITAEIYLSDFGEAFDASEMPICRRLGGIPLAYKAPEILFERAQGFAGDTWAVACCMHYLRFGFGPMDTMGGLRFTVHSMIELLGDLPHQWSRLYFDGLRNAKPRSEYAQNKASKENIDIGPFLDRLEPESLEDWPKISTGFPRKADFKTGSEDVQSVGQVPESRRGKVQQVGNLGFRVPITTDEATCMADLLFQLLKWNPQDRAEPNQLLGHKWFDESTFADDDIVATVSQPLLQLDITLRNGMAIEPSNVDPTE